MSIPSAGILPCNSLPHTKRECCLCLHTDKFVHVRTELSQGIKNHKNRANEKRLVTKGKTSRGFKPRHVRGPFSRN